MWTVKTGKSELSKTDHMKKTIISKEISPCPKHCSSRSSYRLWFQEKLDLSCVHSPAVAELMRCIRNQMESLITGLPPREISAMSLGLAHRLEEQTLLHSCSCCLWLHLLSETLCGFSSAFVTTTETATPQAGTSTIFWCFMQLTNVFRLFSLVCPATSWSSVQTKWTLWSCRPYVSFIFTIQEKMH